ncbi:transglutaminase domain-containing protein [Hanstruepera flava]|uniref:transglutaminase domain-containing protein n=1 Tax=Hanstruepera flava TaxID=2930218 RepID=UPI00202880D3|nr:transglutaminase domain-containing protein [Hanstruepera flava]
MKNITLILIALFSFNSFSQDYRFGKVSKDELLEKRNSQDTSAHATILYHNQEIYYQYSQNDGFTQVNTMYRRIKIYDKEGYNWATHQIRLYDQSASSGEDLKSLRGYTYHLENGKVKKTKLKSESIFEEKESDNWELLKFTLPNINDGVVIEYEYAIHSPYIALEDVVLQELIPIKQLDFEVRIPEFFNFNKTVNPKSTYYPEVLESEYDRVENTYARNRVTTSRGTQSSTTEGSEWRFKERKTEVHETNIPALVYEPYVDNLRNYQTRISWEYAFFRGPDGEIKTYSTTWDKVVETIYRNDNFGGQLNKTSYFDDDLDAVLAGVDDPMEKAARVFNFVKSKVKWNKFVSIYSNDGVKSAYKTGSGNVSEINLMLTAMLRYAGLTANPVLVSTRSHGIPILPTRSGFNYVISAIEVQDGLILLDATNPYTTANILPEHVINWQGRIVREHGSSAWIPLNSNTSSKETVSLNIKINDDLSIDGKVRDHLTNHLAFDFREQYNNINNELHIQKLEEDKGEIEISNLEISGGKELSKPIMYSYDYHLENAIEEIGDKLYMSPMIFMEPKENPFKQEARLYPIDIIYPRSEKYVVNMMLPDGYIVESLPKNTKIQYNNNEGEFTYLARENGKMLQFTINLDMNKTLILPENYPEFKRFFELMIEKETEKIVLKKV